MQNKTIIIIRKSLQECRVKDAKTRPEKNYHQGFYDALEWVLRDEEMNAEIKKIFCTTAPDGEHIITIEGRCDQCKRRITR